MEEDRQKNAIYVFDRSLRRSKNKPELQGYFSPTGFLFKLVNVICLCFLVFGSYFCFDNPAALAEAFHNDLDMSAENYVLLYSIYSWPNIILCFFGGFLIDKVFGVRWGTIVYLVLTVFGHLVFAIGAYHNIFWLMIIGRFIFGIGSESLSVAQNSYTVHCFQEKELNFYFSLQLSFGRLGSMLSFLVMGYIYDYVSNTLGLVGPHCIGVSLFVAALSFVFSTVSAFLMTVMDKQTEKLSKLREKKKFEVAKLSDLKNFKPEFWLLFLLSILYYGSVYAFISLGKDFFIRKYAFEATAANTANSLIYGISALASPIFGILINKTGKNVIWIIFGIAGSFLAHGLLAFTYLSPYICLLVLGLSFTAFTSSVWPFIASIVPQQNSGTAYGLIEASLNLSLVASSIVSGLIVGSYGYFILEIFFFLLMWISLITAVTMWKL